MSYTVCIVIIIRTYSELVVERKTTELGRAIEADKKKIYTCNRISLATPSSVTVSGYALARKGGMRGGPSRVGSLLKYI